RIAMRLQENDLRMDGWSNAYNEQTYIQSGFDGVEASRRAAADIRERLDFFADNPLSAYKFFKNKLRSTWTEPTFQSLWSGPLEDCGQPVKTGFLKNLYGGGASYEAVNVFGSVINTLIYAFALAGAAFSLISRRKTGFFGLSVSMYLVGGFIFHTVWETKSQYVYPYVYMLIPLAAGSLARACRAADEFFSKKFHN
ncbi:MAG: hypothetical protein NC223_11310, partial [Butyrivibrio sp.]|nr:hypothetical protein [Butyrivibrio sp.]